MPKVSQAQAKLNRQRVVEVAAAMFRERGLHGVGVADIMASAGLTHGGFYGQFASKEALAVEAFDLAANQNWRPDDLDGWMAGYLTLGHVRNPGLGCPLACLANDVSREAPGSPLRARFLHGARGLIERMTGLLPAALAKRRRQRALASLSLMIGAVALARAIDDDELSEEVLAAARGVLTTGKVG
ncbi:TetR/AcrR family transcriptional regulator [Methylobacterium sp. SD274]|uniref:TetR family transcriptional regulator n=1 Tax=Methylobacterium sp. SD274 TaxID=2782009 RepID=UPI001A9641D3|nr:TetR/AcrR family transcriptional regulator [Methylobacterium sp. SD274]